MNEWAVVVVYIIFLFVIMIHNTHAKRTRLLECRENVAITLAQHFTTLNEPETICKLDFRDIWYLVYRDGALVSNTFLEYNDIDDAKTFRDRLKKEDEMLVRGFIWDGPNTHAKKHKSFSVAHGTNAEYDLFVLTTSM